VLSKLIELLSVVVQLHDICVATLWHKKIRPDGTGRLDTRGSHVVDELFGAQVPTHATRIADHSCQYRRPRAIGHRRTDDRNLQIPETRNHLANPSSPEVATASCISKGVGTGQSPPRRASAAAGLIRAAARPAGHVPARRLQPIP